MFVFLQSPDVWAHCVLVFQDMISSDEDAGDESKEKWNQPPQARSPKPPTPKVEAPVEVWVDPICKIFQSSETLPAEEELAMVSFVPEAAAEAGSSQQFSMESLIKTEPEPMAHPKPPPREYMFAEMGFPLSFVRSAMDQLQQHGEWPNTFLKISHVSNLHRL